MAVIHLRRGGYDTFRVMLSLFCKVRCPSTYTRKILPISFTYPEKKVHVRYQGLVQGITSERNDLLTTVSNLLGQPSVLMNQRFRNNLSSSLYVFHQPFRINLSSSFVCVPSAIPHQLVKFFVCVPSVIPHQLVKFLCMCSIGDSASTCRVLCIEFPISQCLIMMCWGEGQVQTSVEQGYLF